MHWLQFTLRWTRFGDGDKTMCTLHPYLLSTPPFQLSWNIVADCRDLDIRNHECSPLRLRVVMMLMLFKM